MDLKDIDNAKKLKEAKEDLNKLEEILDDNSKFRVHSNKIYYEITGKSEYASYIVIERAKNKLKYGDLPFEKIAKYLIRRKIIEMLRQAVNAYINVELLKKIVDEQKDN